MEKIKRHYIELPIGDNETIAVFNNHIISVITNGKGCIVHTTNPSYPRIDLEDFTYQEILDAMEP
jgi:hypothetical protein